MNKQELDRRIERAQSESFIIVEIDNGYRLCSPLAPANQWLVTKGEHPVCSCPDFQHHAEDVDWKCKHTIAVANYLLKKSRGPEGNGSGENPTPAPNPEPPAKKVAARNNGSPQMLIKRSVSPDGRIDSFSIEIAFPIGKTSTEEIKVSAGNILKLQSEILADFVKANSAKATQPKPEPPAPKPGTAPATMPEAGAGLAATLLNVTSLKTRFGPRLCVNVAVNGDTLKLFGSAKQLAEAIIAAGFPDRAERISEGAQLNLPCRVITKPNGQYLNIERVLPAGPEKGA